MIAHDLKRFQLFHWNNNIYQVRDFPKDNPDLIVVREIGWVDSRGMFVPNVSLSAQDQKFNAYAEVTSCGLLYRPEVENS